MVCVIAVEDQATSDSAGASGIKLLTGPRAFQSQISGTRVPENPARSSE